MRSRPLCMVCLLYILVQGIVLMLTSGESLVEIPASSIFFSQEEQEVVIRGQVYKKSNTSNIQQIYLKNNSVSDSRILIYDKKSTDVSIGQYITVRGITGIFETAPNPGNFDQALHYARQDIYGVIWSEEVLHVEGKSQWFLEGLYKIKIRWKEALVEQMGQETGSVLAAMLLAEKGEMDAEVKELYQKNGIGHVLAISGLHISFIGLGIYRIIKKGGFGYFWSGILSVSVLSLYVLMIGFSVSVFRAYVMLLLRIGADMSGRVYDMLTALMLAASFTVAMEPLYLTDAGFYLSYGAVLGILLVIHPLQSCFQSKGKVFSALLSSVGVNIALLPVLLWFYFEFPVYSVLWNLFVIPLMSFVLGLGMAGSFVMLLWKPLGLPFFFACKMILILYEWTCRIGSQLPLAKLVIGKPKFWMVILYYGILFFVLIVIPKIKKRRKRKYVWLSLVCIVIIMAFPSRGKLTITMLNVGQGDSIFLQGPSGKTYLIDGGSSDVGSLGKYRIEPFLKSQGIGALDYVFLTHGDLDHCNGVEEMFARKSVGINIRHLVLPANYGTDEMLTRIANAAKRVGTEVLVMHAGEYLVEGELKITCIQPIKGEYLEKNAGSLILDVRYGGFSMLCTGDVEKEGEELLLERIKGNQYTVLKVAHHGSIYSTSQEFLESVRPQIALISSGKDNRYNHPHPDILRRLEDAGCQILHTVKNGAITIETDGNSLTIY